MSTKVNGRVHTIGATEQKSEKLTIREIWVETTDGKFSEVIPVQFINDKIDLVNNLKVGDEVEIGVNLRGRVWKDRCFLSLNGWTMMLTNNSSFQQRSGMSYKDDLPI